MPNPNVIAEELHNEREHLQLGLKKHIGKKTKQIMLDRIHQIERQLDLPLTQYNGV